MEELFDTHAHLDFPDFDDDREEVIARAGEQGVSHIVTVGSGGGLGSAARAVKVAEGRAQVFATAGVHPHDAKLMQDRDLERLRELASRGKVVAVGETGLDYAKEYSPREVQLRRFRDQLALAKELGLPVVIHDREAHDDIVRVLKRDGIADAGGVMHCFSGSADLALQLVGMGFYISIPGVITFKNAKGLPRVAREVPLEKLLVETDSPFLAPEPHRGRRNEPAYVRLVAEAVAKARDCELSRVAAATFANAGRVFNIPA